MAAGHAVQVDCSSLGTALVWFLPMKLELRPWVPELGRSQVHVCIRLSALWSTSPNQQAYLRRLPWEPEVMNVQGGSACILWVSASRRQEHPLGRGCWSCSVQVVRREAKAWQAGGWLCWGRVWLEVSQNPCCGLWVAQRHANSSPSAVTVPELQRQPCCSGQMGLAMRPGPPLEYASVAIQ